MTTASHASCHDSVLSMQGRKCHSTKTLNICITASADDGQVTMTPEDKLKEQPKKTIGFDVEHKRQQLSPGTVTLTE